VRTAKTRPSTRPSPRSLKVSECSAADTATGFWCSIQGALPPWKSHRAARSCERLSWPVVRRAPGRRRFHPFRSPLAVDPGEIAVQLPVGEHLHLIRDALPMTHPDAVVMIFLTYELRRAPSRAGRGPCVACAMPGIASAAPVVIAAGVSSSSIGCRSDSATVSITATSSGGSVAAPLHRATKIIYGGGIRHWAVWCVVFLVLTGKNSEADVDSYRSVQACDCEGRTTADSAGPISEGARVSRQDPVRVTGAGGRKGFQA
jgi:hypothetical protein